MNLVEVYYFSGTGNSLAVAKDIADKLDAYLIPVSSFMTSDSISINADVIGLVFPVYDFKPPLIIQNFVTKINNIDSKYLFAVCTYGIAPLQSLQYLNKVITSCGGRLSAGFAVEMPHNGIGSSKISEEHHKRMFTDWKNKVEEVCQYIIKEKKGNIESGNLISRKLIIKFIKMTPSLIKFLSNMLLKGINSMNFTADTNCNGCGRCKNICPVNNIQIEGNKPVWSDHCAGCFACLHWCPEEAISLGGLKMGIKRYHHPDVSISDMINIRT